MDSHKDRRRQATAALRNRRQSLRDAQRNQRRAGLVDSDAVMAPEAKENAVPSTQKLTKAVLLRQQQLERWRQERDAKRLVEQRSQKPVFRCGRVRGGLAPPDALPPVKDARPDKGFQHVTARIDSGLKSLTPSIQFASTSKIPMIFTGTSDKYLTSDEDADLIESKEKTNRRAATSKVVKRPIVSKTERAPASAQTGLKKNESKAKVRQRALASKAVKPVTTAKPDRAPVLTTAKETEKPKSTLQSVKEDPKASKVFREIPAHVSPVTMQRTVVRKSGTPAPAKKATPATTPKSLPVTPKAAEVEKAKTMKVTPKPLPVTPKAAEVEKAKTVTTPFAKVGSSRKAPGSRVKKRVAPEEEDLVTDDDSFSLGCTPSGKVRRIENGKPLPVIRKSSELLRLKTTEERVAALMQSPMVEFRKRRSCFTADGSSPCGESLLSEEEQVRREERLEMRAEVMQKVAADYVKSPEAHIEGGSPLKRLDPTSARKVRRKSRLLQEAFACSAQKTGQPINALTAHHFRCLLSDETTRLEELRAKWEPLSFNIDIPSHAQAEIAAVIGQTELLFRHKFFFYEQMITKHENGVNGGRGALEGRLVTAEDLLGYWELMHLEIDNLDARYARLSEWEGKGWSGSLADLENAAAPAESDRRSPPRKKIVVKAKRVVKKPVTSKFAAFRAQMKKKANEEETDTAESVGQSSSGEAAATKTPPSNTPPSRGPSGAPLRSALKSGRRQTSRQSAAAVRFAPSSPRNQQEEEDLRTPSPPAAARARRQLTPYREKRVSARRSAAVAACDSFASPQRRPLRRRSASLHTMPASPRATTPASGEVTGRPKTGTPFPEPRASSGSRRRIAELRTNAGLSLRTEEARRQSSSCSPPVRRVAGGRTRQSSVRFNEVDDDEDGHMTMPMTPYNRNSLVPMSRRSRASSAPRSKSNGSSSSSSASSSASTSASRVRFDSDTYSPPADQPSAPVTPFSKDSLVPLPRRHRQSNSTAAPKTQESDGATFEETITPPLTPRLVDVTPLRRSARQQRRSANNEGAPAGDVSLL